MVDNEGQAKSSHALYLSWQSWGCLLFGYRILLCHQETAFYKAPSGLTTRFSQLYIYSICVKCWSQKIYSRWINIGTQTQHSSCAITTLLALNAHPYTHWNMHSANTIGFVWANEHHKAAMNPNTSHHSWYLMISMAGHNDLLCYVRPKSFNTEWMQMNSLPCGKPEKASSLAEEAHDLTSVVKLCNVDDCGWGKWRAKVKAVQAGFLMRIRFLAGLLEPLF